MSDSEEVERPWLVRSPLPALLMLAIGIASIALMWNADESARRVPTLVASVLVVLALLDLGSRTWMPFKSFFTRFWGADFRNPEMSFVPPLGKEVEVILWSVGCLLGIMFIGVLPTVPVYIFLYMWVSGKRPLVESLVVAVGFTLLLYVSFELLMQSKLYRGALFSTHGILSW